jgi:hypothetical protein
MLHQGQDPPTVECCSHHARGQPAQTKLPQCIEERLQLLLIFLDDAVHPVLPPRHEDLAGEARQLAVVVAQVEPAVVPPAVRGDELSHDVQLTSARLHLDSAASSVYHLLHSLLIRLLGEMLHLEEVEPQLLVGLDPEVPLVDGRKNGGL